MIEAIQQYFLPCMINILTVVYVLYKILKPNQIFKVKNIIIVLALIFLSIINFIYIEDFVRFFTSTLYIIILSKFMFKEPLHKIATAVIMEQMILFISELIYMLIIILVMNFNGNSLFEHIQGTIMTNLLICIIAILLINIKSINKIYDKIIKYMEKIKHKNKYLLVFIFFLTINILIVIMYISSNNLTMVIINVVFMLIYSSVVYLLLNEKNQNIIVKEENKNLLDNLNEYEKMLDYQRVSSHENKNQLLVIKGMVNKNNKKLHNYIDEVINEKRADNETLYTKAKRIPSGGLQGLVYQKMLRMQDENINIDLNVSSEVRKINLSDFNAKVNYDICRVIGIIIDNAVDETLKVEDKEISISMYKEDNEFIIEVANKCKELPNLEKIDNKGYTTKSAGHGYGLSLLKDICENNKAIINERKIVGNIFFQIIKIKM